MISSHCFPSYTLHLLKCIQVGWYLVGWPFDVSYPAEISEKFLEVDVVRSSHRFKASFLSCILEFVLHRSYSTISI